MEPSIIKQLGLATIAWTLYFLIVFLGFNFIYHRMRGKPPKNPNTTVILRGRPTPALTLWLEKDRRLRLLFIALGLFVMLLPLLLPFILKLFL